VGEPESSKEAVVKRLAAWLWPTLFGPQDVTDPEVEHLVLPPEPMFKAPDEAEWRPL
jgi:hypothetical protein